MSQYPTTPQQPGTSPGTAGFAMTSRIMTFAWAGACFFILLAMWFVLGTESDAWHVTPWVALGQLGLLVVMHLLIGQIGYRVAPLPTDASPAQVSTMTQQRWQAAFVVRLVLSELPLIVSLAGAFVLGHGGWTVALGGAVVTGVLIAVHGWPGRGPVTKVAEALEANGRPSGLREAFGVA